MAGGSLRTAWLAVGLVTTTLSLARSAEALPVRGTGELQYQSTDSPGLLRPEESWVKILRMDYARRLPAAFELASHFVFSERTVVGRPDRSRNPEGTLQLAHRYVGLLTTYRPIETRDASGFINRQQELSLSGYAQKAGLPQISGSWVRRHHDSSPGSPAASSVVRTLAGTYALGRTSFRAGYGDQYQDAQNAPSQRTGEHHVNLGSSTQFQIGRAATSLSYDFSQSHTDPSGYRSQVTRAQTAGVNSGLQISKRTTSSLSYAYRHTSTLGTAAGRTDEHVGALSVAHHLGPGIDVSGGGGVRNATVNGLIETESYVLVGASAEGDARPGWHLGSAASHSVNWLPGQRARPADSFRSFTRMRLAPGLEANGDLLISTSRSPAGAPGVSSPRRDYSLQSTAGVTARPLRTLSLDGLASSYRAGPSLLRAGSATTSYTGSVRLRPSNQMQLNGTWGVASSPGVTSTTRQGSLQWSPNPSLQIFASYNRAKQESSGLAGTGRSAQESWSGSAVMALARDLTGTFRYTVANPGQITHVRQLNATLVKSFGR